MKDYYMSDGDASVKKFSTLNAGYLTVLSKAVMSYRTGNRTQKLQNSRTDKKMAKPKLTIGTKQKLQSSIPFPIFPSSIPFLWNGFINAYMLA